MASSAPPSIYFPSIHWNLSFYTEVDSNVTLKYVNANFLRCTGYTFSRAITTSFNGIIYALNGIGTTNINASGTITTNLFNGSGAGLTNLKSSNVSGGVLSVNVGGTGKNTLTVTQILVGNNTNPVTQSANLTWDNTNNILAVTGTSQFSGLITTNDGLTIPINKTLTVNGQSSANIFTSSGLLTANTITSSGLLTANGGIQASTIRIGQGGLLKVATSTADMTQIGTTDSLLNVATCINLNGTTRATYPSCILHTCQGSGHHVFFTVASGFIDERMRIWSNGAVGIQKPDNSSTPGGAGGFAIYNNYMQGGSLAIGNCGQNYGGGNNWTANTAGFMMECLNNTEIVTHDEGNSLMSFMYYTGNTFRIGRNMGYGVANTFFLVLLIVISINMWGVVHF
jgi:hypothetical protein